MICGGKQDFHHALLPALAAAFALGLGACDSGPPSEKIGKDVDRAIDESTRGWEQAANIADEKTDRAAGAPGEKAATGARTTEDAALRDKVRSALGAEPGLQTLAIDANATNGAVTLYGTADTPARRDKAAQVALNVGGVKSVTNHLIILKGS